MSKKYLIEFIGEYDYVAPWIGQEEPTTMGEEFEKMKELILKSEVKDIVEFKFIDIKKDGLEETGHEDVQMLMATGKLPPIVKVNKLVATYGRYQHNIVLEMVRFLIEEEENNN
ncbi:MAG: hypothetical protein N4A76_17005 [Firmicutes bacterium]|jgi:hypothetical protein|nr:hypothetical protein [Bacillota bacterium]